MPHLDPVASRTDRVSRRWRIAVGMLLALPGVALAQAPSTPQTHSVRPGDTLWSLAQSYLGDPLLWPEIYRLNTDVVEDPHWIYPGEVLRLAAGEGVKSVPAEDTPPPAAVAQAGDSAAVPGAKVDAVEDPNFKETIEETADDYDPDAPLFPQMGEMSQAARATVKAYSEKNYRAIRRDEFYSGGFLTEEKNLPLGRIVGRTASPMIASLTNFGVAKLYTDLAVSPPKGASYQIGDTLLILEKGWQVNDYGYMVLPTGIGIIKRIDDGRPIMTVDHIYWSIYPGQWLMPLEKFPASSKARAVPITDGITAEIIGWPRRPYMKLPQSNFFINKGSADGVALGDIWEVRRESAGISSAGTVLTSENMATVQIVNVREHSATALITNVKYATFPLGTSVVQIAKLPQ
jgi:LysM repeat protein